MAVCFTYLKLLLQLIYGALSYQEIRDNSSEIRDNCFFHDNFIKQSTESLRLSEYDRGLLADDSQFVSFKNYRKSIMRNFIFENFVEKYFLT